MNNFMERLGVENWRRLGSKIVMVIAFFGLIFESAANIWGIHILMQLGQFAQSIVSAAAIAFGINAHYQDVLDNRARGD